MVPLPPIRLRVAAAADAALVAGLINALDRTEGGPGRATAEIVLRHGFGDRPLFEVVLAEADGRALGYALYYDAFDSVLAAPALWMEDLYVAPEARRTGVASLLMGAVARAAEARGARVVAWGVRTWNRGGIDFYRAIGATDEDARIFSLSGEALGRLAGAGDVAVA